MAYSILFGFIVLGYMISGLAMFESAWKKTVRHREVNEARDGPFPSVRRLDAPHWKKWKFIPMALFFLTGRVAIWVATCVSCCLLNKLVMFGHDYKNPMPAWRRSLS